MIYNQWYAVMPSNEVCEGAITAVRRLNIDFVFFRGKNGEPGCVADQCTHRGARLSKGVIKEGCISCPFHGLKFNTDGKCVYIPANGKASKEDISRYNVRNYPVREAHGIIYVWYGDEGKESTELPYFDEELDESYSYSEISDLWNSHYSRCIENQLDVVHVPIVHYNTIGRGNKMLVNGPKAVFENGVIKTSAQNAADTGQKPKQPEECEINPKQNLNFKFPNVWMNYIAPKIKVLIYFAPVDDENTILYIRFYCSVSKVKPLNAFIAFFGKFANRVIERQDKRVVITQRPKASSYKSEEKLLIGDGPIIMYRKIRDELKNRARNDS